MECHCLVLILRVVVTTFLKIFYFFYALDAVAVLNMDITYRNPFETLHLSISISLHFFLGLEPHASPIAVLFLLIPN